MGTNLIVIEPEYSPSMQLIHYAAACHAIAEALAVDEVKEIRNKATAIQAYAQQARNFELERQAAEIRTRAEIRAGEILIDMNKAGLRETGRPEKRTRVGTPTSLPRLEDLGITRQESHRWQKLARIPKPVREALLTDKTIVPSAANMIRATEEPKPKTSVSSEAVGLWSMLRDFENDGLLDKEPTEVLSTATAKMLDDVHRLAPRVAKWLRRIGKILPET